jgi:hypothetical protein
LPRKLAQVVEKVVVIYLKISCIPYDCTRAITEVQDEGEMFPFFGIESAHYELI